MPPNNRIVTAKEAAKMVYATSAPTEKEVGKIREKIHKGLLQRSSKGGWTTTTEAVAQYLAHHAVTQAGSSTEAKAHANEIRKRINQHAPRHDLTGSYENLLRDYFLAVVMQRTKRKRSQAFDRAVLAGQFAFVILAFALVTIAVQSSWVTLSAEKSAVLVWLDKNAEHGYSIVQWFPPVDSNDGQSTKVRVRYKYYTSSRKSILTDREFYIDRGVVQRVTQTE